MQTDTENNVVVDRKKIQNDKTNNATAQRSAASHMYHYIIVPIKAFKNCIYI